MNNWEWVADRLDPFIERAEAVLIQVERLKEKSAYPSPECAACKLVAELLPELKMIRNSARTVTQ